MQWCLPVLLLTLVSLCPAVAAGGEWTIELTLHGQRLEGTPLAWSRTSLDFLGRDGVWRTFGLDEAENYRNLHNGFRPLTSGEMRAMLAGEFGRGYEVSGAGGYLVVHPAGQRSQWADRFDALYRSFVQYFAVRGLTPSSPRFPLVAVVFPSRSEFSAYAVRQGMNVSGDLMGYYSRDSNRILLIVHGTETPIDVRLPDVLEGATAFTALWSSADEAPAEDQRRYLPGDVLPVAGTSMQLFRVE